MPVAVLDAALHRQQQSSGSIRTRRFPPTDSAFGIFAIPMSQRVDDVSKIVGFTYPDQKVAWNR
jgi:hypothetical protein